MLNRHHTYEVWETPIGIPDRIKIQGSEYEVIKIQAQIRNTYGYKQMSVEISVKVDDCIFSYSLAINLKDLSVYMNRYKLESMRIVYGEMKVEGEVYEKCKNLYESFIRIYIARLFCYGKWKNKKSKFLKHMLHYHWFYHNSKESMGNYKTPTEIKNRNPKLFT